MNDYLQQRDPIEHGDPGTRSDGVGSEVYQMSTPVPHLTLGKRSGITADIWKKVFSKTGGVIFALPVLEWSFPKGQFFAQKIAAGLSKPFILLFGSELFPEGGSRR